MKEYLKLDKKTYLLKFEKIVESFSEKLQEYIKNPNIENIHDIRVAIRRLEAAYRILPKNLRNKDRIRNFLKRTRKLFKLNAEIRDFDIICAKMESRYQDKTCELVSSLSNLRIEDLRSASKLAMAISNLNTPKISASSFKESKINKNYLKILYEINLDIQKNSIIALQDERKIEELHMLRKDYKKLRYLLELTSNKKKIIRILRGLKVIQDTLGEIHDSDIIIDYLRNIKQHLKYSDVVKSEVLERRKKYKMFVSTFKKSTRHVINL